MGMKIDKAIEYNEYLKTYMEINDKKSTHKFLEENHIALNMAIDTMRKYEKIEKILDDCLLDDWEILKSIREVIDNGTDDT